MVKYSKKRTKSFVRDGSVQHFKIGGGKRNRTKSFVRDGSVQHFKIGGNRKRRLKRKSLKKSKRHGGHKKIVQ